MPSLAVIIVNYNTRTLLAHCLRSVYASHTDYPYQVLVVDNMSSDDSVTMVREEFPQSTVIASDRNGGFGYANNLALRWLARQTQVQSPRSKVPGPKSHVQSRDLQPSTFNLQPSTFNFEHGPPKGKQPQAEIPDHGDSPFRFPCDYVLFLNPDTVLPAEALQATVDFLEAHPAAGIVGPKMVKPDGSLDLACRRSFPTPTSSLFKLTGLSRLFPRSRLVARYNLTFLSDDETAEVDSVMGAYMLVRAEALEQAGLFDERFFMYGEDLDLAFRVKERGWKVFYYPQVQVLHHKGASSRKQSERSIREFYRAMHIFHRKHYSERYIGPINAIITLGILARGALALLWNATRPAERKRVT